ncbi:hypothetical protein AOZ07_11535 [Glutamicibacter halophytocola]|uniref:hypothetical protein n=1 Tax=Glutamicibacter halophytocola TaxID=1933880 RepID=UPI0006D4A1A6|nr:hypothetical protein [Glutamicibacter halophytocola]ALG29550.1 hypothetical protein AOZ07_11535 [Glutamicibacter halophytocola]
MKHALIALGALPVVLTACSGTTQAALSVPESIGDAEYALYFSAPSTELDQENQYGKVVLVDADGSLSAIPTLGMDYGAMAWTEKALVFSDMRNDYLLDQSGLQSIPSEKTDSQYAMLATGPESVVGIYNFGFSDEGGYGTQIVTTTGGESSLNEVEGGYYVTANCGGKIFGAGRATGRYSKTGDPETEPVMFNQITGTPDGKEKQVGLNEKARDNAIVPDAPCVDGKVYYISDSVGGGLEDPMKPVLSIWDTDTGKYTEVPMRADVLGKPLMSHEDAGYPQMTAESIRDGKLEWFGVGNSIMSTDLTTGATKKKFEVAGYTDDSVRSRAIFHGDEVVQLVEPYDDGKYEIVRYDRRTGQELGRTTIDDDVADVHGGLFLRGFALKP